MHSRVFVCCKRVQQHDSMLSGTTPVLQLQCVKAAQVVWAQQSNRIQHIIIYFIYSILYYYFICLFIIFYQLFISDVAHAGGPAGMWL